jgi:hypothetical protein
VVRVRVVVVAIVLCASAVPTWAQPERDPDLFTAKLSYNGAQFRAAADDVARALARRPDDPEVLAMHALVASRLGDEATAIASARRAIELGARGPVEVELAALEHAAAARRRAAQRGSELSRRSAPAFVDQLIEGLAAGRPAAQLAEAFDPVTWMYGADPSRAGFVRVLEHEISSARVLAPLGIIVYLGWVVAPETRESADGGVWVHVDAAIAFVVTKSVRDAFEAALDGDEEAKALVEGGLIVPLRNIPYSERDPVLDALVGTRQLDKVGFEVEVAGSPGAWRITDVAFVDGRRLRRDYVQFEKLARRAPAPRREPAIPTWVGGLIAIAGAAAALTFAFRRRARRRR